MAKQEKQEGKEIHLFKALTAVAFALVLTAPGMPSALAQEKVSIAWTPGADVPQLSVAIDRNLWKEEGLDVNFVAFASGRETFEALTGGQVDFAVPAEFPAVTGAMRKQKFGVLTVLSRYRSNRIIATSAVGMTGIKDLANRKIGVTLGTNSHYALDRELQGAGIKAEIVNVGPADLVPALARGDIDAAMMFPSFYGQARRVLGDRYAELRIPEYATTFILLGTLDAIEKRLAVTAKVLKVLLKAEAIVASDPKSAQESIVKVIGKAANADVIRAAWTDYEYRATLDDELLQLMLKEGQWIRERGLIKDVTPDEPMFRAAINDAPLRSIDPKRVPLK
jgi:NitT/TauT family transport system substrate-binding protein